MNLRFRAPAQLAITGLLMLVSIGFIEKKNGDNSVNRVVVKIDNQYDNYFVEEEDVYALTRQNGQDYLVGTPFDEIDLKALERRIESHHFVKEAQVYRDLKGNLMIQVKQSRPIARIIRPKAPDAYISEDGQILPVSERFTARVPLISGKAADKLVEQDLVNYDEGKKILSFLRHIDATPFLHAQIAGISMATDGSMVLYPQVTKQYIEFGTADDYLQKFRKLRIFYKDILPRKGWNHYEKVNLQYKDQIICE